MMTNLTLENTQTDENTSSQALTESSSQDSLELDLFLPIAVLSVLCAGVLLLAGVYERYYEKKMREDRDRVEVEKIEDDKVDYLRPVSMLRRFSLLSFNN